MRGWWVVVLLWALVVADGRAQEMPAEIRGEWKITRMIPTRNPSCWGADQAKELLGSTLRYRAHEMTWRGGAVAIPETLTRTLTRRDFRNEYSLDLSELGIGAAAVTEIDLQHEDADITGATTEVPGDTVLLAGPGRIVVSACGVYFAAVRVGR